LFLDGAVAEWSGHTSTVIALCHVNDGMLRAASYMRQHHSLVFTSQFQNFLCFLIYLRIIRK
jgi:hypothetical protein